MVCIRGVPERYSPGPLHCDRRVCSPRDPVWSAWIAVWSAWIPVEIGGKYSFRGQFRPLPNTELEAYLAKVRVASSSLVSRSNRP